MSDLLNLIVGIGAWMMMAAAFLRIVFGPWDGLARLRRTEAALRRQVAAQEAERWDVWAWIAALSNTTAIRVAAAWEEYRRR